MNWIKTLSHNKPIASNLKANTYQLQTRCLSHFILVAIHSLPLLVNLRQINLRQTSSSVSLMSCWSVSDLTPFNTLSSPSNSLQSRKRKLLMPKDVDVTRCLALSKVKWKLWEKTLLNKPKWVKNSKFVVKWWLYGHAREKLLEESEPFKWNVFTRLASTATGKSIQRTYCTTKNWVKRQDNHDVYFRPGLKNSEFGRFRRIKKSFSWQSKLKSRAYQLTTLRRLSSSGHG